MSIRDLVRRERWASNRILWNRLGNGILAAEPGWFRGMNPAGYPDPPLQWRTVTDEEMEALWRFRDELLRQPFDVLFADVRAIFGSEP